jgi:hypothetical protein
MSNFFTTRKGLTEAIASTFRKNYPSFFPNLPFFQELSIGDFGVYENGIFTKKGNLSDFGVPIRNSSHELHTSFNFSSANTSCQEAGGDASSGIVPVKPSLSIKLEQENAYFCCGVFVAQTTLLDPNKALEKHINFLNVHNQWDKNYRIISSVYTARNFVFMAATEKAVQASAELSYSPTLPSVDSAPFSQAVAHYSITKKTNIGHEIYTCTATPQVVVCMQMLKLKRNGNLLNYKGLNSVPGESVLLDEEENDSYILAIMDE